MSRSGQGPNPRAAESPGLPLRTAHWESLEGRLFLSAEVRGTFFADLNASGTRDGNEPALAAWTVYLDLNGNGALNDGEPTTTTGGDGSYAFTGLAPGFYQVAAVLPGGWRQTHPDPAPDPDEGLSPLAGGPGGSSALGSAIRRASDLSRYSKKELDAADGWIVGLGKAQSAKRLAKRLGADAARSAGFLPRAFLVSYKDSGASGAIIKALRRAKVDYFYPLVQRSFVRRVLPNDVNFPSQWHLRNSGQSGGTAGEDVRVESAWNTTLGAGATIGFVDDGLEHTHPDLSPNYLAADSYDFLDDEPDPRVSPAWLMQHGTGVAGVAAARGNNGIGISGVAPMAGIAGLRLIGGPVTDQQQASALQYHRNSIHIYNNSWGPPDTGQSLERPGPLLAAAIADGAVSGRSGKGSIFVWAAGNGAANSDNVNYDGFANNRHVLAVGAIDHNGHDTVYSEQGAPLLVSAYSDPAGVWTTDLTGSEGAANGDYTGEFGGTSATTAVLSGVVALMLSANPNLTVRDVKHILVSTARKNDPTDTGWALNGAGRWVNHKFGFGAVDAAAAVSAAMSWTPVALEDSVSSGQINLTQAVPDNDTTGISSSVFISKAVRVESVEVVFDATHFARGDLEVVLVSPEGTESVLARQRNDTNPNYFSWTFTSMRHWDEVSRGNWTLRVRDLDQGTTGTVNHWQLNVYGAPLAQAAQYANLQDAEIATGRDFAFKVDAVQGTAGDDSFYVRVDPATGSSLELFSGSAPTGSPIYAFPVNAVGDLVFNTLDGGDSLTVEVSPTLDAIPINGILFNAGADSQDRLTVRATGLEASYLAGASADSGTLSLGSRSIQFVSTTGLNVQGLSKLTLVSPRGADSLSVSGDQIAGTSGGIAIAPVKFSDTPLVELDTAANDATGASDDTITIAAPGITAGGFSTLRLKTGTGTNQLNVDGGVTDFESLDGTSLNVLARNAGTVLNLMSIQRFARLEVQDTARVNLTPGGAKTLIIRDLLLGNSATLDLHDNDLLIQADAGTRETLFAHVRDRVNSARNLGPGGVGSWTGPGISSFSAAGFPGGLTGLAAIKNTDNNVTALFPNFNGHWSPSDAILVKYTWNGDADLNGRLNADDYARIDRGFLSRSTTYRWGDIDYSSLTDLDDLVLLDAAFLGQSLVL